MVTCDKASFRSRCYKHERIEAHMLYEDCLKYVHATFR